MSRSYKKNPVVTDGSPHNTQHSKRLASRRLRRSLNNGDELLQGSKYKRHTCSYDIHDYKMRVTWLENKLEYENDLNCFNRWRYKNLKELYKYWSKYYKRK